MARNPNKGRVAEGEQHVVEFIKEDNLTGETSRIDWLFNVDNECVICGSRVETETCIRKIKLQKCGR